MSEKPRIGFIGLGFMGHGMASCFVDQGYPLTVMAHRKREAIDELVGRGAIEVATPKEMAVQTDVVILMVTGAAQVQETVAGADGLAAGVEGGLIVIDCTTSDPNTITRLAGSYADIGMEFADSPVGRSPAEARKGELAAFVGASDELLARIRTVVEVYASDVFHIGPLGSGHKMKLVNNLISIGYGALFAEVFALAGKVGLSAQAVDEVIRGSRMNNEFYRTFSQGIVNGDSDAHAFSLRNGLKDISCITAMAEAENQAIPIASSVRDLYALVVAGGYGDENMPALPEAWGRLTDADIIEARSCLKTNP